MNNEEYEEIINKPNEDAFFSISYYMSGKLGLKGAELMLYGLINGFSQDGKSFCFSSMQYIEDLTGLSHTTVARAMESLIQKNLVISEQVQCFQKQTESGRIITVKAKGSQYFALRYTVKSRPKIQKMIDDLSLYSKEILKSYKDLTKIKHLIRQIKNTEARNKVKNFNPELAENFISKAEKLSLETKEDVSKALLLIHYNSFNDESIMLLLSELKTICNINNLERTEPTSIKMGLVKNTNKIDESQNGTGTSPKMRHNNNSDNNLKLKTTTTMNSTVNLNNYVAVASDFSNILVKLFGYNPCFPENTLKTLMTLFTKNSLSFDYLEEYITSMFSQLQKTCKDKSKFAIYFLKTFLYEQYIAKFAYDIQQEKIKKQQAEANKISCPVCGCRHNKHSSCPECNFSEENLNDEYEISKAKAIRNLKTSDYQKFLKYEQALKEIFNSYPLQKLLINKNLFTERQNAINEVEYKFLGIKHDKTA